MEQKFEYLKYEYTPDEITAAAHDLAAANHRRDGIEKRKKEVVASLTAEMEEQKAAITRLSELIRMGFEYRDIEVRIELDTPEAGKKRTIRIDTGEEVSVKPMTDTDRQMVLDLQSKAEAAEEAAKNQPKEPIVTPPPFVMRLESGIPVPNGERVVDGAVTLEMPSAGPTLAPARTQGGTHAKARRDARRRIPEAEAFTDGSAAEFDGVPDEFMPEESPE